MASGEATDSSTSMSVSASTSTHVKDDTMEKITQDLEWVIEHTIRTCSTPKEQMMGIMSDLTKKDSLAPIMTNPMVQMGIMMAINNNDINTCIDMIFGCPEIPPDIAKKVYSKGLTLKQIQNVLTEEIEQMKTNE